MASKAWRHGAERGLERSLKDNPDALATYQEVRRRMRLRYYDHLDVLVQKHLGDFDLEEAYVFANLHTWMMEGDILIATIEVGQEPIADSMLAEQNRRRSSLPPPFTAEFWGGKALNDGQLRWSSPIKVGQVLPGTGEERWRMIPENSAPLEVGYTELGTTFMHLVDEHFLARWPYGSKTITLLHVVGGEIARSCE